MYLNTCENHAVVPIGSSSSISLSCHPFVSVYPCVHEGSCIQVLEISARELGVCDDLDLSITNLGDLDNITEVSDTAVNLDLVLKELLECGNVEDLVAGGLRSIDNELLHCQPFHL
jgi:hypothetical protein